MIWELTERGIALCNLLQFWSFWRQTVGLVGENGLEPARETLDAVNSRAKRLKWSTPYKLLRHPTLFWLYPKDRMLTFMCEAGAAISLLLLLQPSGAFSNTPSDSFFSKLTLLLWPLLSVLNLSLSVVLGPFNLQMEPMLTELCFLTALAAPLRSTNLEWAGLWLFRWYSFRVMLAAGLVKWFGSPMWRALTAMSVHYYTQPLPNRVSYYAHHQPEILHKLSTAISMIIEIPIAFLFFGPWQWMRGIAMLGAWALMLAINVTGNYGNLGITTIVASFPALNSGHPDLSKLPPPSIWIAAPLILCMICYATLSLVPLLDTTRGRVQLPEKLVQAHYAVRSLRVVNRYGMFGAMHNFRHELILEGSDDGKNWKRFPMRYKPWHGDVAPATAFLYWPRLDWHHFFIPLHLHREGSYHSPPDWFYRLMQAILKNEPTVMALLGPSPFGKRAPRFVRTSIYDFKFAPFTWTITWPTLSSLLPSWLTPNPQSPKTVGKRSNGPGKHEEGEVIAGSAEGKISGEKELDEEEDEEEALVEEEEEEEEGDTPDILSLRARSQSSGTGRRSDGENSAVGSRTRSQSPNVGTKTQRPQERMGKWWIEKRLGTYAQVSLDPDDSEAEDRWSRW